MHREDYLITIKGVSPIQFSRRHDTPKANGESEDAYDLRTWQERAHYEGEYVVVPPDALGTMLIAGAARLGMKFKGAQRFGSVFKGGLFVSTAMKVGKRGDLVMNPVPCSSNGISSLTGNPGKQVLRRFPLLQKWGGTYRVHVLRPEITRDILREHAEFAHSFIGLGAFRPQNGRNFGRAEVVSVEVVAKVRAA